MHTESLPRILFHQVPEDLQSTFADLPGTHVFINNLWEIHASDHDLVVTFERTLNIKTTWNVLGFGLEEVVIGDGYELHTASKNYARVVAVGGGGLAQGAKALIQRSIIDCIEGTPRSVWQRYKWIGINKSQVGDIGTGVTPLVELGAEKAAHAIIVKLTSERFVWALPAQTIDHRAWVVEVLNRLSEVYPEQFPGSPDWQVGTAWATVGILAAQARVDELKIRHDRLILEAAQDLAQAEAEAKLARETAAAGPWRLLTESGDDLVSAVREALTVVGLAVHEPDEENHDKLGRRLEDLKVTDPADSGWECLVEVKGYAKGAKANDVGQVTGAPSVYFASQNGRPPSAVWHVVNVERGVDPSVRAASLPADEDLDSLTQACGALIDTRDLFRAWRDIESSKVAAQEVLGSLRAARTRWTWPES